MFRHVPNLLTGCRLGLAFVFFFLLSEYQYVGESGMWLVHAAVGIYIIALATDFLDGYLARRWRVEGVFGRIVDPFVDKVLVLGTFVFLAGKNFTVPKANPQDIPGNVMTITGVVPWMVVVILARELLITALRANSEEMGEDFSARWSGKVKMGIQAFTILVVLLYVNYKHWLDDHGHQQSAQLARDACIWATLAVTVFSGLLYVRRAVDLYHAKAQRWRLLVTFGGIGLLPAAPGTWASALAALLLLLARLNCEPAAFTTVLVGGVIVSGALCVALGPWAIRHFGRADPSQVVLDEVAGMCVTILLLPSRAGWGQAWIILTALAAFRVFDIVKPSPARQLERLPAGWGILLDDLAAGVYANLVCQVIWRILA